MCAKHREPEGGGWVCEYVVQVELNGWLPRGPIEGGTIDAIKDFLRHVGTLDFSSLSGGGAAGPS